MTILVWNKLSSCWLIDIEISRNRSFIYHIVLIIKCCPIVILGYWTLELLLLFHLLKPSILCHLFLLLCYLLLQLLLLFQSFQLCSLCLLFSSLLFCLYWVRLHIYRKGVTIWLSRNIEWFNLLTGITRAANVLPLTTLRSYMIFWGATLLKQKIPKWVSD